MYKKQELEKIKDNQIEFLFACALAKLDSEQIDNLIYSIEKIRRKVIK